MITFTREQLEAMERSVNAAPLVLRREEAHAVLELAKLGLRADEAISANLALRTELDRTRTLLRETKSALEPAHRVDEEGTVSTYPAKSGDAIAAAATILRSVPTGDVPTVEPAGKDTSHFGGREEMIDRYRELRSANSKLAQERDEARADRDRWSARVVELEKRRARAMAAFEGLEVARG